jgi:hypothetical protein
MDGGQPARRGGSPAAARRFHGIIPAKIHPQSALPPRRTFDYPHHVRTLSILVLLAAPAWAATPHPETTQDDPFAPASLVLNPATPPELPRPEKFWREPLPTADERDAQATAAEEEAARQIAEANERDRRTTALFQAVADSDPAAALALLEEGADINAPLPLPADPDFVARFRGSHLHYFVTVEGGVTPLMLAAGLGDADMVRFLLERGASPRARTTRHKTFALWLAGKGNHADVMQILLGVTPGSDADLMRIEVDLDAQQAVLLRDGATVTTAPISTGRKGYRTPAGEYVVTDKHRKWRSTIYPADMPFFMRLSCGEIGFHEGKLPGYPASHGCIRLRRQDAAEFFKHVPIGTRVVIK